VNPKKIGYHVSALYSPFGWKSWAEIAEEWEKSQGDDPKLKTFYNTVLGETFKEKSDAPQWELLYERGEDYKMNLAFKEVVFITAGADVQADRIEVEIIGWMPGKRSQQIDFRVLMGDTTKSDVWQQLADILSEQWEREDGSLLGLRLMAVDSGYNTQKVYDFAKKYGFTRVVPVKGNEKLDMIFSPPRSVDTTKHGKKVGKIKVWHVGVSHVKSEVYGFLRLSKDPETGLIPNGYCHLPKREPHYFRSLTAEVLQVQRNNRGYIVYVWVKKYERNEALDCRVYGRAAASIIGMDRWTAEQWAAQNAKVIPATKAKDETATKAKPVQRVKKKSDYWKR
jgi:phage terminase large subunit GpA-like protein